VLDLLGALINDSLVRRAEDHHGQTRFDMLETIREYAAERLDAEPDADEVRERHARYFLDLAVQAEPHFVGMDQTTWLDRFEHDHDNVRTALKWSIRVGEIELGQRAAGALWRFWHQRGYLAEGRRKLEHLLHAQGGEAPTAARFKALTGAGGLAYWQNDYAAVERFYAEALEIARSLGDPGCIAEGLYNLSFVDRIRGNEEAGMAKLREVLEMARSIGDQALAADSLGLLGNYEMRQGHPERAVEMVEEGLAILREQGSRFAVADTLSGLASTYRLLGDREAARAATREALETFVDVGNPTGVAMVLEEIAMVETVEGQHDRALRLAGAASALKDEIGGGAPEELMRTAESFQQSRTSLGAEAADRAWAEGREMGTEKAIAYALEGI
jgi:tetratricopeptide (TPR) repeat protein